MREAFFGPEAWAPLASSWQAYLAGDLRAELAVHADDGEMEIMPVSVFFRGEEGLMDVDRAALALAKGRVLDGGAGVGSLALLLQERGFEVTALEVIPQGVKAMRDRGVTDAREGRLEALEAEGSYDTVLLLMNGTALAGTLDGLPAFLDVLQGLLAPGGQLLMDSTDFLQGERWEEEEEGYPGELQYQMEFEGVRGAPFPQLFVDPGMLAEVAERAGWRMEVAFEGEAGEYLARLTLAGSSGPD